MQHMTIFKQSLNHPLHLLMFPFNTDGFFVLTHDDWNPTNRDRLRDSCFVASAKEDRSSNLAPHLSAL